MFTQDQVPEVIGRTVYSADGDKIGTVGQVFLDDQSSEPEFVTVNTGLFGTSESFVPAQRASLDGDRIVVPFEKDQVKDAPRVDVDGGHLDPSQEQRLYEYYGLGYDSDGVADGTGLASGRTDTADLGEGHDTSGPNTDQAMTRSEEHLEVGTTQQEAGRARLRKYVTTEQETHTVPVRKEKAVLETEPVTDANADAALGGPAISEEEHEVTLNEERVVVSKEAQPVERVRLGTETVTEEQEVTDEVRKEHIEAEGDVDDRR
jgi:uncharacterized protein (TIGR02271 family)